MQLGGLLRMLRFQERKTEGGKRPSHLADGRQFVEQHLEDRRRQRLLQHLQQLLGLTAHRDGVGQVVGTLVKVA